MKPFIQMINSNGLTVVAEYIDGTHCNLFYDYSSYLEGLGSPLHIGQLTDESFFKQLEEWLHMVSYADNLKRYDEDQANRCIKRDATKDKVYHVYSGLDAFVVHTANGDVYPPYMAIVAKTELEARENVAKILGQKLDDQDTNPDYDNFVSTHVEYIRPF